MSNKIFESFSQDLYQSMRFLRIVGALAFFLPKPSHGFRLLRGYGACHFGPIEWGAF